MAKSVITTIELEEYNNAIEVVSENFFTAIDAENGTCYEHRERDDKYLIIAQNTGASPATLTIKKGNGIQAVVDKVISISAGSTVCITLESGMFKNVSGEDKGKVVFEGTEDIELAIVKLP